MKNSTRPLWDNDEIATIGTNNLLTIQAMKQADCIWLSRRTLGNIALRNIAFQAWNQDRLDRAMSLASNGKIQPPVSAVAFQWRGRTLYDLTDGNHRCAAAALRGRSYIRASVTGINFVRLRLWDNCLWHLTPEGVWRGYANTPAEPVLQEMLRIGLVTLERRWQHS